MTSDMEKKAQQKLGAPVGSCHQFFCCERLNVRRKNKLSSRERPLESNWQGGVRTVTARRNYTRRQAKTPSRINQIPYIRLNVVPSTSSTLVARKSTAAASSETLRELHGRPFRCQESPLLSGVPVFVSTSKLSPSVPSPALLLDQPLFEGRARQVPVLYLSLATTPFQSAKLV